MAARIFTCHHLVPRHVSPANRLFGTLISGVHSDPVAGYHGDLDGDNIAGENVYSELRHQFYVWRNLLGMYDYVGFEHYRRVFFIDPAPSVIARAADPLRWAWRRHFHSAQDVAYADTSAENIQSYLAYRAGFDEDACRAVEQWIAHYDIIVPRPFMHGGLERQWKSCLPADVWDITFAAVEDALATAGASHDLGGDVQTGFFNNMYIMRADLFNQYMHFFMHCAERILNRATPFQRILGHCGERIFSLWLYQRRIDDPMLRVHHLPFLHSSAEVAPNLPGDYSLSTPLLSPKRRGRRRNSA